MSTDVATKVTRPILFSGEMVRAILDGHKTQTRRVMKPQPEVLDDIQYYVSNSPFKTGMTLWVRETWASGSAYDSYNPSALTPHTGKVWYRDTPDPDKQCGKWRPSIFMPRWASRITLEITDARIERVQDITAEDALSEGVVNDQALQGHHRTWVPQRLFSRLWDRINERRGYGWNANPWIWGVEFKKWK